MTLLDLLKAKNAAVASAAASSDCEVFIEDVQAPVDLTDDATFGICVNICHGVGSEQPRYETFQVNINLNTGEAVSTLITKGYDDVHQG